MIYGNNTFELRIIDCMNVFLRGIGAMRSHVLQTAYSMARIFKPNPKKNVHGVPTATNSQRLVFDVDMDDELQAISEKDAFMETTQGFLDVRASSDAENGRSRSSTLDVACNIIVLRNQDWEKREVHQGGVELMRALRSVRLRGP